MQFDPWDRGLVLLTLVLSLQASYAAPLILLAQNRQEARDRVQSENDREVADRTQTDTEFLAREIAGVRLMLADVVTGEELREQLAALSAAIDAAVKRLDEHPASRRVDLPSHPGVWGMPVNSCRRTPWRSTLPRIVAAGRSGSDVVITPPAWSPAAEQGDHRRGDGRRRRADQLGDADDVGDPRAAVVACPAPRRGGRRCRPRDAAG